MITWILDQHVDKVKGRKTPFIEEALLRKHTVYGLRDSLIPKPIDLSNIVVNYPTIVPADVYVIDIAETSIGYKIVEYNQFSTSAMYNCNESLIINALEKFLN